MKGFFGSLFDLNHDGVLDNLEKAADFAAFANAMDDLKDATGMDTDDLEFMNPDERQEILEDAGLDLDDFDF